MRILFFEDEKYTYEMMREMLYSFMPDCQIIGPIDSVAEGIDFFAQNTEHLDMIIADIQLNDGLSFFALSHAPTDIPIIFTTAYDEYALKAFQYNSLSYLLKPVDEKELYKAVTKAQQRLITDEHRKELFSMMAKSLKYRERFLVNTFRGEKIISVAQVRYIVSEQKTTFIVLLDGTSFSINKSLTTLEQELDPARFMRVNRKFIVPITEVESLERELNGKEILRLKGKDSPEIIISRDKREAVHKWLK